IELLKGRVVLPEIILTKPHILLEKSPEGRPNWEIQTDEADPEDRTDFPIIERLRIEDGRLGYLDLIKDTYIVATFATTKGQSSAEESTQLQAKGKLNGRPLTINLNAGPLVALRQAEIPYPLTLEAQAGETLAKIEGTFMQPLQFKGFDLNFVMKGPNPEQLSQMLGVPLPSLPPYQLKGELSHHEKMWQIKDMNGRVGDSDLAGNVSVDMSKEPYFIKANLISDKIDLDDFGPIVGLAPDTGPGETASSAQEKEAKKEEESAFLLPHESISFEKLQNMNVNLKLRSKHVESKLPVDDLNLQVIIKEGHLVLAPLDFGVAAGNVRSRLEFDTRNQPATSKIETEIRHVRLSEILSRFEIADESAGLIGGQGAFWFKGDSIAEMLASADGGLLMIMTGGHLDDLLVELAGLDIGEALVALFGDDSDAKINCAFADLPTKDGIMTMDSFIVDTPDSVFMGKGSIDFNKEQLDLIIDPKPKDLSIFSARAPLHIDGSFKEPAFIPGASAILRGAASLALLPSAPIVSLYAFLQEEKYDKEGKAEENVHCSGLVNAINEARE
ncbi:MAG: AsmA family protein, partial [Nitrosomonas sp.]|nr:AsmA family protein [Nitrosomonas sp.]